MTPQIIEREILTWLLGPDGPDPGARILTEHAPERAEALYEAFERYNLPRELVSTLVGRALADLDGATLAEFAGLGFLGPRLRFLARHRPGETAEAIRRIVESTELTELEARVRERRSLVWNLMVLSRRPPSFEPAEAALFRLACAENEELANNATRSWAQLFSSTRNMSHRSLEARLDLLERRLDDDVGARRVALIGLEDALTNWEFGFVGEAHDDSWPQPTTEEIRAGRLRAWGLLCHRGTDPEPTIAEAARRLAAKLLRAALRQGIGAEVMDMLAEQVGAWPMSARVQLRETLEEARAYDGDLTARSPDSLARLESALAPETFVERLRLRVGTWGPATLAQGHGAELDDALADEGLQGELPLRAELPWLLTEEAQRPHVFAFAIGRRDTASVLFTDLQALAAAHPDSWRAQALVAGYLGGMVEAGRSAQAQVFADELRTNPSAAALALIEVGVRPERLAWLEDTLASGQLPPFVVEELGRRNDPLDSVDDDALLHLLGLMKGGDPAQQKAALNLMISRFGDNLSMSPPDILEALLESLAAIPIDSGTAHRWSLGAFALVERGQPARAAELALRCMSQPSNENTPFWRVLHAAASREPSGVFWVVARALDEPTVGGRLLVSFWFHRQPFVWPSEDVLEWVGDDQRRGRAAAGIVHVTSDELPVALRELIRRFGPTSSVAKEIGLRIESTQGLVSSLAEHARQQLSRVRTWLDDSDPAVATFARSLVDELEQDLERHSAYEEDMHRRFGT
ncbi:MAG: hypothetical protein KC431_18075 [Myxococcales bacterium]|nr:hypothetical protein [Myxococcales bacterium]